jgi:HEPN domain-containing protein
VRNLDLARDYVTRAGIRLEALEVLYRGESWADVVRESQEIVELTLKGLLRAFGVTPPMAYDVSACLLAERDRFPEAIQPELEALASISRELRRDRELAFYGAEDLTPSSFYSKRDATSARRGAKKAVEVVRPHVLRE